ncbi:MAG: hypothetical protein ABIR51_01290 [Sphingomicrobium sp.]
MIEDWRLENLRADDLLFGITLRRMHYRLFGPAWDHDHCCGCFATLALPETSIEALHEGYATTEDYVHGPEYAWVCVECFDLFAREMQWKISFD